VPRLIFWVVVVIVIAAFVSRRISRRNGPTHDGSAHATQRALAPDFTLPQLNGQPLTLSSFRGKIVLLDFWATWCVPCRAETPHFVELQQKYGDRGLQIIGISMDDSPDPVGPFVKQFQVNYPIVMGTAKTGEQYGGILGMPIAFLIDREGHIVSKHIGATDAAVFEKEIVGMLAAQ
jgi:thiol-disulfide isomerase/thioredoxin